MENGNDGSLGSTDIPISSKVDPTGVMPPFPQGKEVSSMSIEEAQGEWSLMTTGDKKYENWPRDVFLSRRDGLWERGFSAKIAGEEKARQEESETWLEKENRRLEDRDDQDRERKAKELGIKVFGSEKEFDRSIKKAIGTKKGLSKENKDFLNTETPNGQFAYGDLPFVISLLAGIGAEPDLIEAVNSIGLEKLIKLADKSGIFRRRK